MISCQQYDYIEIACLFKLPVTLTLLNGQQLSGQAVDTRYNAQHQECIVLVTSMGEQLIATSQLRSMKAQFQNPHFDVIEFVQSS